MRKQIRVAGAVIVRDGLILCAQRGLQGTLPGLWEFPGGKIEPGESNRETVAREIVEELGCVVAVGEEITTTTHEYEFGEVTLTTYYCELESGDPQSSEHSALAWLAPGDLQQIEWAPADIPAVERIQADLI